MDVMCTARPRIIVLRGFLVEEVLIPGTLQSILPPLPIISAEQKGAAATEKDGEEDAKEIVGEEHAATWQTSSYRLKCPRHHQMAYRSRRRLATSLYQHSYHRPLMKQAKTRSCNPIHTRLDKGCDRKTEARTGQAVDLRISKSQGCISFVAKVTSLAVQRPNTPGGDSSSKLEHSTLSPSQHDKLKRKALPSPSLSCAHKRVPVSGEMTANM